MDVQVDGRFVRSVPVSFAVEAYREAWVAPKPIAGGVVLMPGMIEQREVEITGQTGAGVDAGIAQVGAATGIWRTTKALREGQALSTRDIAPAPAIARGDWVTLQLRSGPIELESRAEALQDGELGQRVKVRLPDRASPLEGRVVDRSRVEAKL